MFQQVAYRPGKLGAHLDQEKEARGGTSVQTQSLANMWGSYVTFLSYSFYFPSPALVGVTDAHPCLCMATSALELPLLLLSGVEGDSGLTLDLFLQSIDLSAWSQGPPFFLKTRPLPFPAAKETDCSCQFSETAVFSRCKKSDCVLVQTSESSGDALMRSAKMKG